MKLKLNKKKIKNLSKSNSLAVLQTAQVAGGRGFGATWYCDNTNGRICGALSASDAPCFRE